MGNRRLLLKRRTGNQPPIVPLTIVNGDSKTGTSTLTHNLTGVPAGALIVITTTSQNTGTNASVNSTPSLTWTKRVDAATPQSPGAEIYTAVHAAGGSLDITVNWGAGVVQTSRVYVLTGQEVTLAGNFATGLGQSTSAVPITTTKANSIVFVTSSNWNAPTLPFTYRGTPTVTLEHRDPLHGTYTHYFYNISVVGQVLPPNGVGYSDPSDVDNGTSTAVLEIRSASGVLGNQAPVANAGANQTITLPTTSVNLSGSLSTDDVAIASYLWTRISGPNTPTITTPTNVNTSVTGLIQGVYVFRLQVTDGPGLSNTDDVQITVNATNNAPVANAGPNQTITLPTNSVTLDSSASTDDVGITSRTWTRTSGPNTPTIVTPNGITTNVTGLIAGIYIFRITVQDAGALTNFDEVQITVNSQGNSAPSAPILSSSGHTQTTVNLEWTASIDDVGVSNYRIYRNNSLINTVSTATLAYQDTGLINNTTYTYRVEAVDGQGAFTPSNDLPVTTGTINPPTPFTFTALTDDYARYWGGSEMWNENSRANCKAVPATPGSMVNLTTMHYYRRFSWCDIEGSPAGNYQWAKFDQKVQEAVNNKQLFSFGIMTIFPEIADAGGFNAFISGVSGISQRTGSNATGVLSYPLYLHQLMQAEGTRNWVNNSGDWIPNFNSLNYINRLAALYQAIVNHLATTTYSGILGTHVIGYVDLRGMGAYGEWHSNGIISGNVNQYPGFVDPHNNPGNLGTFPSAARLIQIVDAHRNNITLWPLCTILNSLDGNFPNGGNYGGTGFDNTAIPASVGQYIMNNGNAWGPIGWRRDQWGDTNDYYRIIPQETNGITGIVNRWQTAPVIGEPPGYNNSGTQVNGVHMAALNLAAGSNGQQVANQHPSIIGNGNYGCPRNPECNPNCCIPSNPCDCGCISGSGTADNMRTAFKAMGCILRLVTGGGITITANQFQIQTIWRNFGVAPQYKKNWAVTFELRFNGNLAWSGVSTLNLYSNPTLKSNAGGNHTQNDTFARPALSPGTYQLSVRILDPNGYMNPLQLGIEGRQTNGSYILSNITL